MLLSEGREYKPYDYFATPDGHDVLQKLGFVLKPAAMTAFAVSTTDVLLHSKPRGYLQILGRYIYISAPILGASTAFVVVSNVAGTVRQTDDKVNWFLGGAAAGSVVGVWRGSTVGGFVAAAALGMAALIKKHCQDRGMEFLPDVKCQVGGIWSTRQDWTLTKYRPGNWTTGQEAGDRK